MVATAGKRHGRDVPQTGSSVSRLAEAEVVPAVGAASGVHICSVLNLVRPVRTCGCGGRCL